MMENVYKILKNAVDKWCKCARDNCKNECMFTCFDCGERKTK